jgi:hypothetical protein
MTEPITTIQGPQSANPTTPVSGGGAASSASTPSATVTLGIAPPSPISSYEAFVPWTVRVEIAKIEEPEDRLTVQDEAVRFFSGQTIYRYTSGGPYPGNRLSARFTLDNGDQCFVYFDSKVPQFAALEMLFKFGIGVENVQQNSTIRDTNLLSSLEKYLDWRSEKLASDLKEAKEAEGETRAARLQQLVIEVRGLCELLDIDLAGKNLDVLLQLEEVIGTIKQRMTEAAEPNLIDTAAAVLASDSGASREDVSDMLNLIKQNRLRIAFREFGAKLHQLDRQDLSVSLNIGGSVETLDLQGIYVWNEEPINELTPFLKVIGSVMFGAENADTLTELCSAIDTPSRKGRLDALLYASRVAGSLPGDIDDTPDPFIKIYYSIPTAPGDTFDYIIASGDDIYRQSLAGGIYAPSSSDTRYAFIDELLHQAGVQGPDLATRAISFYNQHASEILGLGGSEISEDTVNFAQNMAFNTYLSTIIKDPEATERIIEKALDLAKIEDTEERAFVYTILAALRMGTDPNLKDNNGRSFQVTPNGEGLTNISNESLQYIISQAHQFYMIGGEANGETFFALATSNFKIKKQNGQTEWISGKELIRSGFMRFDRQSPGINTAYLAILTIAYEIAKHIEPGVINMDEVVSAAGLSLYGVGNRAVPPSNRQVVLQELTLLSEEIKFQNDNVIPNLGNQFNEVEISAKFMEVLLRIAEENSTQRNIPFYTILENSALYRRAQQINGDIIDPLWILVQYVQVLNFRNEIELPAGFLERMEKFINGEEMISNPDLLLLLNVLNAPLKDDYLKQALDVLTLQEDHALLTAAFQKIVNAGLNDPWYITVDQKVSGDVDLAAAAPTSQPVPPIAGEQTLRADVIEINSDDSIFSQDYLDEPIANLWLLIFDRNPNALTPAERQMFTAAGIEIPLGLDPEERAAFLAGLHRVPAYLSADAIEGLVKIMEERYILYSPINFTGYNSLKRLFEGDLTLRLNGQVASLTQAQRDIIRRILLMRQEEGTITHRILSADEKQALLALVQFMRQSGLSSNDGEALSDIKTALAQMTEEDNLVVINQPVEGLADLNEFAQKLRAGYFKVNGQALQGVASLEAPEGVTHASEYQNYINVLKAISDSLAISTFIEPAPIVGAWNNFKHSILMGVEQSMMANDPDMVLSQLPQGIVRDFKILMYFDCLQQLSPDQRSDIETGNQLIEERNALLIERKQLTSQLAQGQAVSHILTDNSAKLMENAAAFARLLGLTPDGRRLFGPELMGLLDRMPSDSDPSLIGLRLAYLKITSAGLMAMADAKEIQKEKDFEAGVEAMLTERFNGDPAKRDEAKQAYHASEAYRLLDEAFQDSIRPLNELRDIYEMEFGTLSRYVQSDEVDARFMQNFFECFAGNQTSDYGVFEWNFEPTAIAAGTHMLFTDAAGNELSNAQELFNYVKQVFEQVSGSHWASMSRLPSDTNLAVIKAKQIMAYVLMNMPVNEVQISVANAVMNSAGSILERKIPILGKFSILFPIAVGFAEWGLEEAGVDTTTTVGPTSLESLQYYVNSSTGRMEYQAAQMAQGISQPDTQWRQSVGGMAQLIFGDGLDFNAGQSSFDSMRQIGAGIVNNAVEAYTRIMTDLNGSQALKNKIEDAREKGLVSIRFDQLTLDALKALEDFLRDNNLQVNLYDPLNAASALDGVAGATEQIKYGLFALAQLTLEISEIESTIYPQTVMTSEDQLLNPLMGFAPNQILRRYLIEGEGENRQITIVRIDPTDPAKHIITQYRPATLSEHFSSFLDSVGEGFGDFAHTVTNPDGLAEEARDAFSVGLIEGANFKIMIPINIFAGFANDTIKAAKAYISLQIRIAATDDPYEKARLEAEAEILKKRFEESAGHTIGAFAAFENWPGAILSQWLYLMTHDQLGRGIGYGLIVLPFAAQIFSSRLHFLGEIGKFFRGKPVEYAHLTQYGLMSVPLGAWQKGMFAVAKRGWNNNFITRNIDAALNRVSSSVVGSIGHTISHGLGTAYNYTFHNPYVRAIGNFFNIHWGGWSDFTTITHGQHAGLLSQVHNLVTFSKIMLQNLKSKFKAELRAYLEQRGVSGPALDMAVDELWNTFKQSMSDQQAMAEMGLQPLNSGQQLNIMRSQMMQAYGEIIKRESVKFILKKIYGENIPTEVMSGLLQIVTEAEMLDLGIREEVKELESRIRSAEAQGLPNSQIDILRARLERIKSELYLQEQKAEIKAKLDAFIESTCAGMDSQALRDKFKRVIRNNLNRETFTINQDIQMKVGSKSAVKNEIKARIAEIRAKFFETLVPRIQQMARNLIDHIYGPPPPSTPHTPTSGGTPITGGVTPIRPADIFTGFVYEGAIGAEFDAISSERLIEFKTLLEAKGVKLKITIENGLRLSEADFASLKMSVEALEVVEGRNYRLIIRDGGYVIVYSSSGNVEIMTARGNFIGLPGGGGGGGGGGVAVVSEAAPIAILPTTAPAPSAPASSEGAVEGNLALQPQPLEVPPNPYDPLVERGIVVGRDGFSNISSEVMSSFADAMVARKVQFITVAEGVELTEADLARLLDTIPSGKPKGGSVSGLGKPTGRAIVILAPDLIYSVSLYEGMTVENVGNSFRFMLDGEMISTYELRAFEFVNTAAVEGQLASKLNLDINNQLEKITLRIGDLANSAWSEVLERIRGEGGVEFLRSQKGRELVKGFAQGIGGNAASLVMAGLQILGFEFFANTLGIENPSLRFVFTIGGMHALTPPTQALLTGRFNLETISNLAKKTFLTEAGWMNFYSGMGNMVIGGRIYSSVLDGLGLSENPFLSNEFVYLSMSVAIPAAAGALTRGILSALGASTAVRAIFTGIGARIIPLIGWVSLGLNLAFPQIMDHFNGKETYAMSALVVNEWNNLHPDAVPWYDEAMLDTLGFLFEPMEIAYRFNAIPTNEQQDIHNKIIEEMFSGSNDIISNTINHLTSVALEDAVEGMQELEQHLAQGLPWDNFEQDYLADYNSAREALREKIEELFYIEEVNQLDNDGDAISAYPNTGQGVDLIFNLYKMYNMLKTNSSTVDLGEIEQFLSFFNENGTVKNITDLVNYMMDRVDIDLYSIDEARRVMRMQYLIFKPAEMNSFDETSGLATAMTTEYDPETGETWHTYSLNTESSAYTKALEALKETMGDTIENRFVNLIGLALQNGGRVPVGSISEMDISLGLVFADGTLNTNSVFYTDSLQAARSDDRIAFRAAQLIQIQIARVMDTPMSGMPPLSPDDYTQLDIDLGLLTADKKLKTSNPLYQKAMEELREVWRNDYNALSPEEKIARRAMTRVLYTKSGFSPLIQEMLKAYGDQQFITWVAQGTHAGQVTALEGKLEEVMDPNFAVYTSGADAAELNPVAQNIIINGILQEIVNLGN